MAVTTPFEVSGRKVSPGYAPVETTSDEKSLTAGRPLAFRMNNFSLYEHNSRTFLELQHKLPEIGLFVQPK